MACYRLPRHARRDFAHPRGIIVEGDFTPFLREFNAVICVGDVVSEYCSTMGNDNIVLVVDGRTRRHTRLGVKTARGFHVVKVSNPAGTLSIDAENAVCDAARRGGRIMIVVDGEEDMIALAAVECSRDGTAIVYGVPGEGATIIVSGPLTRGDAGSRKLELEPSNECFKPRVTGSTG